MKKIIVLSGNCWLLPEPFSKENDRRLVEIIQLISKLRPDAVALQEVWLNKYITKIRNNLPEYTFVSPTPGDIFNKSGLLIGTKQIPKSVFTIFYPTEDYSIVEKLGNKGFQMLMFENDFVLCNTHLYDPRTSERAKYFALEQLKHVLRAVNGFKDVIIAGDLNLSEEDLLELHTPFKLPKIHADTVVPENIWANSVFNKTVRPIRTDYILTTDQIISEEVIKRPLVSDHYFLLSEIKI